MPAMAHFCKGKMKELKTGIRNRKEMTVTPNETAASAGSGGQPVFSTPHMIALMETTAWSSVEPFMDEGKSTVGTHLDIAHLSASPVGAHIVCESELTLIDRRRLVFRVTASDDAGLIGEGTHERFIVDIDKFMSRAEAKLQK